MLNKIEFFISIIAGIIFSIIEIFLKAPPGEIAFKLLVVMIIFYIIGLFVKAYLTKSVFKEVLATSEDGKFVDEKDTNVNESSYIDKENGLNLDDGDEDDVTRDE